MHQAMVLLSLKSTKVQRVREIPFSSKMLQKSIMVSKVGELEDGYISQDNLIAGSIMLNIKSNSKKSRSRVYCKTRHLSLFNNESLISDQGFEAGFDLVFIDFNVPAANQIHVFGEKELRSPGAHRSAQTWGHR